MKRRADITFPRLSTINVQPSTLNAFLPQYFIGDSSSSGILFLNTHQNLHRVTTDVWSMLDTQGSARETAVVRASQCAYISATC
jgi:hypothetical protein